MSRVLPRRAIPALGLILAGCASPEPDYHRLTVVPGAPRRTSSRIIEVRRIGLPGYLDRSEIMRAGPGTRLEALRNMRWGEGLGGMVGRVLAEDLAQRLPGCTVFNEAGSVTLTADVAVEIEIQRFEANPGGAVELAAQVATRTEAARSGTARTGAARTAAGQSGAARNFRLTAALEGQGAAAVADAMSRALGSLADAIADGLASR